MPRSRWIPLTQADKNWDLFDAIEAGDGEGVLLALKRGADVRATDSYGFMPLHWAVAYVGSSTKDTGIIEALLDRGARYNQRSGTPAVDCYDPPETPLEWAARHPDLRPLRLFFARGGDPNDHDPYMSPLFAAVSEGTVASVELLLSAGAGVDVQNWAGDSLLHCAARTGDIAKIGLVSERGIDVNGRGSVGHTPLHCAAEAGNDAAMALLLAHGAEIHARDDAGKTPLHWAAREGSFEGARSLISRGADVMARDDRGRTPLDLLLLRQESGREPEPHLEQLLQGTYARAKRQEIASRKHENSAEQDPTMEQDFDLEP